MSDAPETEPEIEPIHVVQTMVLSVARWPLRTAFPETFFRQAYLSGAEVDGDVVVFTVGNGAATYRVRRDLPLSMLGVLADLVESEVDGQRTVRGTGGQ
jgi:hypothetical protein